MSITISVACFIHRRTVTLDSYSLIMEYNEKPYISVIIPVYNVESYLRDCLNSIINQTYKNFEILLINDGSTDNSGIICDEYGKKDERIHVFHKENGGVSSARNLGLLKANGVWICFIDSDDWIEPNTFLSLISRVEDEIDFVQFGFQQIDSFGKILMKSNIPDHEIVMNKNAYLNTNIYHSAICGYLIKTSIIRKNNINFPVTIKYGEDQAFILKALMCSHKIHIVNKHFYNYRYREGSAMNSSISFSRAEDHLKVILDVSSFINATQNEFTLLCFNIFTQFVLSYIRIGIDSTHNICMVKKRYSMFCNEIEDARLHQLCNRFDSYFMLIIYYLYLKVLNSSIFSFIKNKVSITQK